MKHTIEHYLPKSSILSSKNSNKAVIDRLGDAVIRQVVISILKGGNYQKRLTHNCVDLFYFIVNSFALLSSLYIKYTLNRNG